MKKEYVFNLGCAAGKAGKAKIINPYASESTYWHWWNEGWEYAKCLSTT